MSYKFKEIGIKNRTYLCFYGIININNLDPNKIKVDQKPYKNFLIYYIGYMTVKYLSYVKTGSVNYYQ